MFSPCQIILGTYVFQCCNPLGPKLLGHKNQTTCDEFGASKMSEVFSKCSRCWKGNVASCANRLAKFPPGWLVLIKKEFFSGKLTCWRKKSPNQKGKWPEPPTMLNFTGWTLGTTLWSGIQDVRLGNSCNVGSRSGFPEPFRRVSWCLKRLVL